LRSLTIALFALAAGCASIPEQAPPVAVVGPDAGPVVEIGRFSRRMQGAALPPGWRPYILLPSKPRTAYALIDTGHGVALEAKAEASASGLYRQVRIDPKHFPIAEWRWRVDDDVAGADSRVASREDSPARLVIAFHGDPKSLDVGTRIQMRIAKSLSGRELPYATLMYVWSRTLPEDTLIANPHTDRIQMIVVASGEETLGRWTSFRRNVLEDYRRAFGEEPVDIESVGVMTDADNTGDNAHAHYGDIWFMRAP